MKFKLTWYSGKPDEIQDGGIVIADTEKEAIKLAYSMHRGSPPYEFLSVEVIGTDAGK